MVCFRSTVGKEKVDLRYSRRLPGKNRHFFAFLGKNAHPDHARHLFLPLWDAKPITRVSSKAKPYGFFREAMEVKKNLQGRSGHQGCPCSPVWTPWRVRHAIWSSVRPDARQNPRFQNRWYGNRFSVVNHQCPAAVPGGRWGEALAPPA